MPKTKKDGRTYDVMPEWRDGQPLCGAFYKKPKCAKELTVGMRVVRSATHMIYCSDKCHDIGEGKR